MRYDDMPAADGSSTRGGSTSVRGRVRSPHMAKLQAASIPIAAWQTMQHVTVVKICLLFCIYTDVFAIKTFEIILLKRF